MEQMRCRIAELGIVPVAVLNDASKAVDLADALMAGGLPCAEITFRTSAAEEAIRCISTHCSEMLVGAGTVLSIEQVKRATEAGARFIVSPGFDPDVVDYCLNADIPIFPGCVTPSEVMQCAKRGLRVVKFFPAEQFGGVAAIKALGAPFADMAFIPTGGVNAANLHEYLACSKVIACGGSWMVKASLIDEGDYETVAALTREAVDIVAQARS